MTLRDRRHRNFSERGSLGPTPGEGLPSLGEVMQQLAALEARLHQLKTGVANLMQLHQLQAAPAEDAQAAAQELLHLQEAADRLEMDLASRVVSWEHLKEPFWQAVRFGGLGVLVGWLLGWLVYARG